MHVRVHVRCKPDASLGLILSYAIVKAVKLAGARELPHAVDLCVRLHDERPARIEPEPRSGQVRQPPCAPLVPILLKVLPRTGLQPRSIPWHEHGVTRCLLACGA